MPGVKNYTLTAKDPKQRGLKGSLGVYSLGVYCLAQPILDLDSYTLGVYTLGVYSLGVYCLGQPILDLSTHSPVLILSGGLLSGGLLSWATDFGSEDPLTCP